MPFKHKLSVRLALLRDAVTLLPVIAAIACETAAITVTTVPVASVTLSPASASLLVGTTQQFSAVPKDPLGNVLTGRVVTWASSNPAAATVSGSGLVTTIAAGLATLTATSEGKSATAPISVRPVPVASVTVNPASASIQVGATQQLAAVTKDSAGATLTGRVVTWSSSSVIVASVAGSGLVTGQAAGTATIAATSEGKTGTATLTVRAPPPATHAGHYVSTLGSAAGDGSASRPWDLLTALGQPAAVLPGDTIWVRGGTYVGAFVSLLTGTAAQPIIVRQYPGERATISGNLVAFGSDTWFWGLEVVSPNPLGPLVNAVQNRAPRIRYINMVVHDASGSGVGLFDNPPIAADPDCELYGSLVYNNGATNNLTHGVYSNNQIGAKKIRDNIVFDNWALGIQVYDAVSTGIAGLNNFTVDGNVSFNNGAISGYAGGPLDLLIGGAPPVTGAVVTNNYLYRNNSANTADIGSYFGALNQDIVFSGNYSYGFVEVDDWVTASVTGNTVYSTTSPYAPLAYGEVAARGNLGGHTWSNNTWYGDPTLPQWGYGPAGSVPGTAYTYANWLSVTGLSGAGSYAGSLPPNLVVVRPNAYEAGRANIIVYNWAQLGTVSADVSAVLHVGDHFVVQNAQNFYGPPVLSGTYAGGSLQLPTAAIPAPAPIGRGVAGPTTGPTFNVFVLLKTS